MYYYVTNLQGDVVAILDSDGNTAAEYSYDAWGKLLSSSGDMAAINPIRYRGYYYDTETELYYLQSRYYDPEICRFINADDYISNGQGFIGTNAFVYCLNNPIIYIDSSGRISELLAIPAVSLLTCVVGTVAVTVIAAVAIVAIVYTAYLIADAINDVVDNINYAKKASNKKAGSKTEVAGGAATPPTPPGNNNRDPNRRGDSTYNKEGIRVDYEYYGNGNGNVHIHTRDGKYTYDFSARIFRTDTGVKAPKSVQNLAQIPEISRALLKGLKYISM